jgi:solute carrier family 35 protein C2
MQYALASAIVHRAFGGALRPKREVPAEVYWRRVAPVGAAMGMDIALSNLSLVFVTVSFYTLVKTSSIIFLLLFAFALKLEPVSFRLMGVAALLTGGQALTVDGETRFDARGCALVVAAAACSGLRWTLSQIVLQGKEPGGGAGGAGDNK